MLMGGYWLRAFEKKYCEMDYIWAWDKVKNTKMDEIIQRGASECVAILLGS
jgi:hypothetical protein